MKPKILYILHCFYNRAGTEEHVRDLLRGLSAKFELSVAFREQQQLFLLKPNGERLSFAAEAPSWPVTPYNQPQTEAALKQILTLVSPDLIHLHHFFNWPLSIFDTLATSKKPVVATFHDYYTVTPYFTMEHVKDARECFSKEYSLQIFKQDISPYLAKRLEVIKKAMASLSVRIVPSSFLADELSKIFPLEYKVIEHGIKPFTPLPRRPTLLALKEKSLQFGYIGSLLPQKGWCSLIKAFSSVRKAFPHAELHLFGGVQDIPASESQGITFEGVYEQDELAQIVSKIDVGIIPSVFPETFCLTLSELWRGGVPTAVSDIGALSRRVQDGINGKKFLSGNVAAIESTLRWFLENDSWTSWQIPQPRLLDSMLTEYDDFYKSLLK